MSEAEAAPDLPVSSEPAAKERPPHRPSSIGWGAFLSFCALASILWLISYTLLDWPWQQSLGGWNYLIVVVLSTIFSQGLQHWHTSE